MSLAQILLNAVMLPSIASAAVIPADAVHIGYENGHVGDKEIEARQCTGCAPPPNVAPKNYCPVITSEEDFTGDPWQSGNSASSGAEVGISHTYTVGMSWSVGGELGLSFEKIVGGSASLSASVSKSKEESFQVSWVKECPEGPWSCSAHVFPGFKRVKGRMALMAAGDKCDMGVKGKDGDWEMIVPRKSKEGTPFYYADLCTCGNLKGADAEGHPEKLCVENCVGPTK